MALIIMGNERERKDLSIRLFKCLRNQKSTSEMQIKSSNELVLK